MFSRLNYSLLSVHSKSCFKNVHPEYVYMSDMKDVMGINIEFN
jgi:hypothetical protein